MNRVLIVNHKFLVYLLIVVITAIAFNIQLAVAQDQRHVKIELLDSPPDWYLDSIELIGPPKIQQRIGEMILIDYRINDSTIFRLEQRISTADDANLGEDPNDEDWSGRAILIKSDTLLVETSKFGFSVPSFSQKGEGVFFQSFNTANEDYMRGDLIWLNLRSGVTTTVRLNIGPTAVKISPYGTMIAYSDFGDVWITSTDDWSSQLVFAGGGSFLIGTQTPSQYTRSENIRWSPDGLSLLFEFRQNVFKDEIKLYKSSIFPD